MLTNRNELLLGFKIKTKKNINRLFYYRFSFALVSHNLIDFIMIFSYRICKGLVHKSFKFI
jgi:hypothetical protein